MDVLVVDVYRWTHVHSTIKMIISPNVARGRKTCSNKKGPGKTRASPTGRKRILTRIRAVSSVTNTNDSILANVMPFVNIQHHLDTNLYPPDSVTRRRVCVGSGSIFCLSR